MLGLPLTVVALFAAAPDAGLAGPRALPGVEGILAPLGHVGDVVEDEVPGGYPPIERVVVARLDGCPRSQALWLSRFVGGVAMAGAQVQSWLDGKGPGAPRGLEQRLFGGKKRVLESVLKARTGGPVDLVPCQALALVDGWKLAPGQAPAKLCKAERRPAAQGGVYLFAVPGQAASAKSLTAVVSVAPAPAKALDRCRPRLSAVLFDDAGKARFGYHADYNEALLVQVAGDACQGLDLVFDARSQTFLPVPRKACAANGR